ncbi:hypothetical protein EJ110_NYTH44928 [Nymphaea thermarum]|nr:hypothetical protein EJ110_NYTH44928 [Nymphaea thermarum]
MKVVEEVPCHWNLCLLLCFSSFINVLYFYLPITSNFLSDCISAAILDIVFTWKAKQSMCFSQKLRLVLKLVAAIIWAILLSFYYAFPRHRSFCFSRMVSSRASQWSCLSPYTITIIAYMIPNAIGVLLFFLPALASCVETSTWKIFAILSWWVQRWLQHSCNVFEKKVLHLSATHNIVNCSLGCMLDEGCKKVQSHRRSETTDSALSWSSYNPSPVTGCCIYDG